MSSARAVAWFCLAAGSICVQAQAPSGILAGRVLDPTGAAVSGARVGVVDRNTGVRRVVVTAERGDYCAPSLQAATYQIEVEASGFRRRTFEAVVEAGTTTTADVVLQLSSTSEAITVSAEPPLIPYAAFDVSSVVTGPQIEAIPLNGRSYLELSKLEPGAQAPVRASNNRTLVPVLGAPAGQSGRATRVTVDSGSIMEVGNGGAAMGFSQGVVQEFELSSANFDLSTGITGSGAINVVTRSGTNDLHGSAFFFFRDHTIAAYPALNWDPFNPDPFFQRRQFGFEAGGPIRKQRMFWFATYERNEQRGVAGTQLLTPEFATFSRISPEPTYTDQFSIRGDFQLTDRHAMFVRYSHEGVASFAPSLTVAGGARALPSAWTRQPAWDDQIVLGVTSQISPDIVNDFHFSYFFVSADELPPDSSDCLGCLGLGAPSITVAPDLIIGNSSRTVVLGRRFQPSDVITWSRGTHRIRLGGEIEINRGGRTDWSNDPVKMTLYSPKVVRDYDASPTTPPNKVIPLPSSFSSLSDILQLPVQSFTVGIGDPHVPQEDFGRARTWPVIHLFAHDTWRIRPSLTLSYGLGWTFETPLNYDLLKPAYLLPLVGEAGLDSNHSSWTNFSPTVGFAWRPGGGRTVLRGGAGIYYDFLVPFGTADPERTSLGPRGVGRGNYASSGIPNPLNIGVPLGTTLYFPIHPTLFTGADLLEVLPEIRALLEQQRGDPNNRDFSVTNLQQDKQGTFITTNMRETSSLQFSIGFQRELKRDFVIGADFVARLFRHIGTGASGIDFNHFLAAGGPVLPVCAAKQRSDPQALCSLGPIYGFTGTGSATYKGLLVRAEKRLSRRWQFLASYAFASDVGNSFSNGLDYKNLLANYGPLDRDVRHILNLSGMVELPAHFQFSWTSVYNSAPPLSAYLGNIDLNGDGTTGDLLPGTMVNGLNRGISKDDLRGLVAAFNAKSAGTLDAKGRLIPAIVFPPNFSFGSPLLTQDIRISRTFGMGDRCRLILMGEVFNLFNFANLSGYSGDLTSPGFGQPTARVDQAFGSGGPRSFQLAARFNF